MHAKSLILVGLQLAALAWLAITGPLVARHSALCVAEAAGLALGLWAVAALGSRVRITPEPAADAELRMRGPYRWIRHPMYAAVLLVTLAVVLDEVTTGRLLTWAALAAVLVVKVRHEERILSARFPAYDAYRARSKRLVPGIW